MDHRWGKRVQVDLPVRVTTRLSVTEGRLMDLSVSGALLHVDLDLRMLCRVQIALVMPPDVARNANIIEAYVTRRHERGCGVEWCELAPSAVNAVLRSMSAISRRRAHLRNAGTGRGMHPSA